MFQIERMSRVSFNCSFLDVIQFGEAFAEIGIALRLNLSLIGLFTVPAIDLIDDVHSHSHLAEWSKPLAVQAGVIFEVDEDLGRAAVRQRTLGKRDIARRVGFLDGFVFNGNCSFQFR